MALTLRNWMFTGSATSFVCPTWQGTFACNPTAACASDNATGRQYCCEDQQGMCWIEAATCATDGSTFNCTRGSSSWCCITNKEICTEASGQINICWASNPRNVLLDIAPNALKSAYTSLSAARPSASSYTFDPQLLMAATTSSSSSSSTTRGGDALSSPTSSSPSSTTLNPNPNQTTNKSDAGAANTAASVPGANNSGSDKGIGAGAIAGIVVGVLVAIALGAALAWFLMRRSQKKKQDAGASELPSDQKYMYAESPAGHGYAEAPLSTVDELPTPVQDHNKYPGVVQPVGELPAAHQHYYAELPVNSPGRQGPQQG